MLEDFFGESEAAEIEKGSAPDAAPAATKLPQDMSDEELERVSAAQRDDEDTDLPPSANGSVGVLVVSEGGILSGIRTEGFCHGLLCGPGGHVEGGETHEQAAIRETLEEFGILPKDLMFIGYGPYEPDTGLKPAIYLATEWEGDVQSLDGEMSDLCFRSLEELNNADSMLFQPFKDSLALLMTVLEPREDDSS